MKKLVVLFVLIAASCSAVSLPKTWVASETILASDLNANFQALNGAISSLTTEVPAGTIVIWSGTQAAIPSGWVLCDGTNGTPDLTDKFVIGAGSTYGVASAAGSTTVAITSTATTTATATTAVTAITDYPDWLASVSAGTDFEVGISTHTHDVAATGTTTITASTTVSSTATGHLPPYYALCYIMKS